MGFAPSDMQLKSSVFNQDGKYTGEGEDVSPALSLDRCPGRHKGICHYLP